MKNVIIVLIIGLVGLTSCSDIVNTQENEALVIQNINEQQEFWNKGDIDGFMSHYWNNDSLMFVSGDRVSYGWQSVTDNYKKNYPTSEIMGQLTFDIVKLDHLSNNAIVVVGSWNLNRMSGEIGGKFTLLWKKIEGDWVIVLDHTS